MPIKPTSAKAKGRRFQQRIRDMILTLWPNLHPDDVKSTSMGAGGEDIQLSPAARKHLPISIECKARKSFAVYKDYAQAEANSNTHQPILFIQADRKKPLAVVDAEYLLGLLKRKGK